MTETLNKEYVKSILKEFKIDAVVTDIINSELSTIINIRISPGVRLSKLSNVAIEISLALRLDSVPFIKPIPGLGLISLEFINFNKKIMFDDYIKDIKSSNLNIPLVLGLKANGEKLISDLALMPHLIVGGTTGSGKSILLNCIINSIFESEKNVIVYMVDPKRVDFGIYSNVKYVKDIVYDVDGTNKLLTNLENLMNNRLKMFRKSRVLDILEYSKLHRKKMPFVIVIIDELAAVINKNNSDGEVLLSKLTSLGRAAGIHLVCATQRPSAMTIKGDIKNNFPARISFKMASKVDSRVILDRNGAENLSGKGSAIIVSDEHNCLFKGFLLTKESIRERCKKYKRGFFDFF